MDAEFFESWLRIPIYTSRVCQVILERIEEHFGHHEPATFTGVTVEHVMPQTLTPEWEHALGDGAVSIHSEWLHTIGNLTLTGYNPELSNIEYPEKRKIFALSHFELNRFFRDCDTWDASQIKRRAHSLFETAQELWPRPRISPEKESRAEQRAEPANFHPECIRAAQAQLGVMFSKLSQTRYDVGDLETRLVCAVSAEHNENVAIPYFWFGVDRNMVEFLEAAPSSWFCFGCGSARFTLLVPLLSIKPYLAKMSVTSGKHRWHIVIQKKDERFVLQLPESAEGPDLTKFLISGSKV